MICKHCGAVIARRNTGFGVWQWVRLDYLPDTIPAICRRNSDTRAHTPRAA